jgi:putative transposase
VVVRGSGIGRDPRGEAPPKCHRSISGEQGVLPSPLGRETGFCERKRHDQAHDADCVRIVHKHRNLLAHAPERLHDEISADYTDMIYAESAKEIETRRKAFLRKWRLKCQAVAGSLEEAGEALFAFTRLPSSQWKSARTTNAIERLHEEFKRRIKTQTVLPSAETAAMLFWALLASGQISMRKVDGWQSLGQPPAKSMIDLAA